LFQKACNLKDGTSCAQLGVMTHDGLGGVRDVAGSKSLFSKACKLGSAAGWELVRRVNAGQH
jgi:TPR repeat protein